MMNQTILTMMEIYYKRKVDRTIRLEKALRSNRTETSVDDKTSKLLEKNNPVV